jgi:hypothetical protein
MSKKLAICSAISIAIKALESVESFDRRLSILINELAKIKKEYSPNNETIKSREAIQLELDL